MSKFLNYGAGRIHYSDQGKGDAIILIHGYLETSEVFNSFAVQLSADFRVITVDLPGHGQSDMYNEVLTMEFMASIISNLLENLNIRKAFVTGHSLGGYVTLAFADIYPKMLSGYCLLHSQPFADTGETIEKRETEIKLVRDGKKDLFYPGNITKMFAPDTLHKFPEALIRAKGIASTIPGEAIIAVLQGMILRPSRVSVLESGKLPCLWILGKKDNYVNCEAVQARVRLPENARVVVLKNSGHLGFIEEEGRTLKLIREFVKRIK